ncbi:GFA family protein [Microvirga massiliensis]|uniref:GFA family protein n=1 Tax=Microvirga massiliensis TaxID=1033741 RepID=UPI00062BE642|nr:GFA family protein [Microvirga massiliensis]
MRIDGRCHCGFIAYEAEIDPEKVMICHCTDCQTLSGSAFRTTALTREGGFRLLSGALKTYVKVAQSGAKRLQGFCPECGSPICATSEGNDPKVYSIRIGTARQRDDLIPKAQIWCRSAQPWVTGLSSIRQLEME